MYLKPKELEHPRTVSYTLENAKIGPSLIFNCPVLSDTFRINLHEIFAFLTHQSGHMRLTFSLHVLATE